MDVGEGSPFLVERGEQVPDPNQPRRRGLLHRLEVPGAGSGAAMPCPSSRQG